MGCFHWYFESKTFCCCLPVRFGVIVMSFLSIMVAGLLTLVMWYEVASTTDISSKTRGGFIGAGLVETFYFIASIFGFIGAVARKQLFVMIYAYFIYLHFLLNVGIAIWLTWLVAHTANSDIAKGCRLGIANDAAKSQCTSLLNLTQGVFISVVGVFLLVEFYCALIIYRYVYQLKNQKRAARASRLGSRESGFRLLSHSRESSVLTPTLKKYPSAASEFDPYEEFRGDSPISSLGPHPDPVQGYGGGRWTHEEIADEEKRRLRDSESPVSGSAATPRIRAPTDDLTIEEAAQYTYALRSAPDNTETETLPGYDFAKDGRTQSVGGKS